MRDIYNLYPDLTVSLITLLILLIIVFIYFCVSKTLNLLENKFKITAGVLYTVIMSVICILGLIILIFNCARFYFEHLV